MKFIAYNFIPVLLVLLAAYMVYANKPYYGWVIAAAVIASVYPTKTKVS